MRVRGLKQNYKLLINPTTVAPHAGAWIETYKMLTMRKQAKVAPHAGAWIETSKNKYNRRAGGSHPMRVRGLKLARTIKTNYLCVVAPHAGAWIETFAVN